MLSNGGAPVGGEGFLPLRKAYLKKATLQRAVPTVVNAGSKLLIFARSKTSNCDLSAFSTSIDYGK
jgi:hypothetical protein